MNKNICGYLLIVAVYLTGIFGFTIKTNAQLVNPVQVDSSSQVKSPAPEKGIRNNGTSIESNPDNTDSTNTKMNENTESNNDDDKGISPPLPQKDDLVSITINAAGDCTLGTDTSFGYSGSFPDEVKKNGYEYIFRNVRSIFAKDDLTIVNLETTFTNATAMANKKFKFKGAPEYTKILTLGSIESVNIANNHIRDYLAKGYSDTISSLKKSGIGYFGYESKYITEIKGIKVGCLGYEGWSSNSSIKKTIKDDIELLRKNGAKLVILSFHWGEERKNYPNSVQKDLGKYAIDSGADLVLGHHPHVIQGIHTYKGKNIVYSLGNFAFGGNRNPSDKDTFIYQQTFEFKEGQLLNTLKTKIIPCSVSSVKTRNNYQPTPLKGKEAENVINRIKKYSDGLR